MLCFPGVPVLHVPTVRMTVSSVLKLLAQNLCQASVITKPTEYGQMAGENYIDYNVLMYMFHTIK